MPRSSVGPRIRETRLALKLTQAELARRVGISASYLNLIEKNRRGIAGKRLSDIAEVLGLRLSDLDGAAERRLAETLEGVAQDRRMADLGIEAEATVELIGRFPGWARAVAALARSEAEQGDLLRAFADRLTHDPFLGESVHGMLTRVAAIRSTAEILEGVPDIDAAQARRFHFILAAESRRLSETAEALAAYFDRAATPDRNVTPTDEMEAYLEEHGHRFDAIEQAVAGASASSMRTARIEAELRAGPVIDRLLAEAEGIRTESAKTRTRAMLLNYAMDAVRAPRERFAEVAAEQRYDIERIAGTLGLEVDLVCRRLTALGRGGDAPAIGYLAANAVGTLTDLRMIPGFHPVRHGPVCPLWALARAPATPGQVVRQLAELPSGRRFVLVARARYTGSAGFEAPRQLATDMIVLSEEDARATVYGFDPSVRQPAEEIGVSCRLCPRKACAHRVDDPLVGPEGQAEGALLGKTDRQDLATL